jgi:hypothetical protein
VDEAVELTRDPYRGLEIAERIPNWDAFTDTQWVTLRGDLPRYPF